MPNIKLTRYETQWIAKDARYVYTDDNNKVHQAALTYGVVYRRILDRVESDMMHTLVEHEGVRYEILSKALGCLSSVVHRMDWLAWLVVNNDGNAFDYERREDGKLIRVEEHALGRYYGMLSILVRAIFDGELDLDRFKLPPHAELFRDVVRYHVDRIPILADCFDRLPTYFDRNVCRFCGELANDLFNLLRHEGKARKISKILASWKGDSVRTFERMQEFKRECFAKHPELFVMQLECGYAPPDGKSPVPINRAKGDHATFVNRLRHNARFAAVAIGGIWSLAWGELKGHRFRWIFFLNAELVQDSTEWVELVAGAWHAAVPEDAAYVRIPGLNDSPSPVAGLVRVDDTVRMRLLDEELDYNAQKDNFIRFREAEGARSWGTWVPANTREDRRRRLIPEE
ncbi:hypothetical protein [Paraburkholderia caribensis]|uniref:hypothetical protein n=1 Tax=Paraburkholderia caribensis TaxID=75105 RepID=UPI0007215CD2|nr:hypothetical protein [Paraburkholderia caribensis]ALP61365.1 hypothetical protein AN416_01340 [Paraburkholderia caribensis]AUT50510.1 hypothetical protein C2L66_00690 [Paraburkholderia caribensis]